MIDSIKVTHEVDVSTYISKSVEVEFTVDRLALQKLSEDVFLDVCSLKGLVVLPFARPELERAYMALTPTTPEPIRALVLACVGRIA